MSRETDDRHAGAISVVHAREKHLKPHPEITHTEHGLAYIVKGWIRVRHQVELRAEAGTMIVVPAGVPHEALAGADLEYWMAGFCAPCVGLDESQLLMQAFRRVRFGAMPAVSIAEKRRARVVRLLQDLREETVRRAPESMELAKSLLLLVLGETRRAMPGESPQAAAGSLVGSALEFIQQRALEPISLADVAAYVHRSPAHVASTVKKATGHSVGAWIRSARVAEAAARLVHTDDSLDEIGAAVGWNDKTHFIRQFRKELGQTPAAFRRDKRGEHASPDES